MSRPLKVLLINPPYDVQRYMGKLSKIAFVFQPIGLTYIASFLREQGVETGIYDSQVEEESISERVRAFNPDIIGITCVTALVYSTIEVAKRIKAEFPGKVIIAGGIHPTIRSQDFLCEPAIDYVCIGEGELTMHEFVLALAEGRDPAQVEGISCRRDGRDFAGPPRAFVQDIDRFPPPALDLVPMERYRTSPDNRTGEQIGVVLTSRGCPFDCIFCSNRLLTKKTYRAHSVERVCSEVSHLIESHHVRQIFVQDDNFAVNKTRAKEICREFIRRGFHRRMSWWAEARVDCVDEELLGLMAAANCRIISYGLESGNQRLLDLICKNITLDRVRQVVAMTRKAGIEIRASFILGLPTETVEESRQTIRFARELGIDQVRFAIATPFPGTRLYDIAQEEGTLRFDDWKQFSMMSGYAGGLPVYAPKGRTPEELARLQRWANLSFYLRPRIILTFLRRMTADRRAFWDISYGALRFVIATLFPDRPAAPASGARDHGGCPR
jgi:radical SAM superfamily enzyme YgiQ (UPF0313 family)